MSFIATQEAKEQVRQATDLVALVGADLPLRRQGRQYVAQCPWHDDARPSLTINPERQTWRCWVCNIGGDVFSYVMQRERVEFREALEMLAENAGIQLGGPAPKTHFGDPNDRQTLLAAMAWAEKTYAEFLGNSADATSARDYLAGRGITEQSVSRFHLGFAPDQWQWLSDRARTTQFSPPVLEAAGLLGKSENGRHYDRFKGRVLFPIRDVQARPIGLGGRILPELSNERSAKYVNSPETRLFSKSDHVYALDLARDAIVETRQAVVVEGYTDVIMAHQHAQRNVVAVLGTALGARHIQLLRRYADTIVLILDGDEAGQRRTNEVLELFVASEVDLRILTLPSALDPCDFLLQHGAEAWQDAVLNASDAFEHALRVHTAGIDLVSDTHRANQALEKLLAMLAKAPRLTENTRSSRLLRERQVMARLARDFRLDEQTLRDRVTDLRRRGGNTASPTEVRVTAAEHPLTLDVLPPADAELLEILLRHAALVHTALEDLPADLITSPIAQQVLRQYRELADRGESCDFHNIMTAVDDTRVKKLLVDLDERAADKEPLAHEDAAARLRQLIDSFTMRGEEMEDRGREAALEDGNVSDKEVLEILNDLLMRQRKRQGIPAPTDG